MTKDDIIDMAKEADIYANCEWEHSKNPKQWEQCRDEHFANLVAAAEREACAKLVETQDTYGDPVEGWFDMLASAIRARSQS